jgi:ATP-dependent helicase/nuclease subunit B
MGGALFWSLKNPWIEMKNVTGDTFTQMQDNAGQLRVEQGRYRGVLKNNEDYISRLESADEIVAPYAIDRKKDGSFKAASDVVTDDDLDTLLLFNEFKIKEIAENILAGTFPLSPFKDGATSTGLMYSPYTPVMMFDAMMGNKYNDISGALKDNEVLAAMKAFIAQYNQTSSQGEK